jgi:hypothetical protein
MAEKPAEDWFTSCLLEMEDILALVDLDNVGLTNENKSGHSIVRSVQYVRPDELEAAPLPPRT